MNTALLEDIKGENPVLFMLNIVLNEPNFIKFNDVIGLHFEDVTMFHFSFCSKDSELQLSALNIHDDLDHDIIMSFDNDNGTYHYIPLPDVDGNSIIRTGFKDAPAYLIIKRFADALRDMIISNLNAFVLKETGTTLEHCENVTNYIVVYFKQS